MVLNDINVLYLFMLFTGVKQCSSQILKKNFLQRAFKLHQSLELNISYEFYTISFSIDP